MPCETVQGEGFTAIACSRGQRKSKPKLCRFCRKNEACLKCDGDFTYPVGPNGKHVAATCDADMCIPCSTRVAANKDLCPVCKRQGRKAL